ncbi:MAG: glycosyltransferase family 4 protein [Deltaproteobacteria bacterium]|nr:glycosyltransferase family 4 protein [Deltaproteobacteria bacterium]
MNSPHILLTNKKRGWAGEATIIAALARGLAERGREIPAVGWTMLQDMQRLARYVRAHDVKLIHSHASFDTWTSVVCRRLYGLPVTTLRTKHNLKEIAETRANRWLYTHGVDHVVAPSTAVDEMLGRSRLVRDEDVTKILNGISLDRGRLYPDGQQKARSELGIPDDTEVVVYISRLSARKDPATLVRAIRALAEQRPRMRLLVVGDGPGEIKAELEQLASGCDRIEFWGYRDDVPRILAASDVFVLPSLVEPFGLAPLEAMLQGVTTIVSDTEGFRDFVRHGENGLVFPKGDASALASTIDSALSDADLRKRLAIAGEKTVREHFYTDRMIDDYAALYDRLTA